MKAWLSATAPGKDAPSKADPAAAAFEALQLRKRTAETLAIEAKLARDQGSVISKQGVATHIFGALQRLHLRLLGDLPTAVANRLAGTARTREEILDLLTSAISTELGECKRAVIESLRSPALDARETPPRGKQHHRGVAVDENQ